MTHFCITAGILAALTMFSWSCASEPDAPGRAALLVDAGILQQPATFGTCQVHSDCTLVPRGCCPACGPAPKSSVVAVANTHITEARKALCPQGGVSCGACWQPTFEPLAARLVAACEDHVCTVVDLREEEITRCTADRDCKVQSAGCCPACSSDPSKYLAINTEAESSLLECAPRPCPTCTDDAYGHEAFCAVDGHCAVKGKGRRDGTASGTCFSPTQNLVRAYEDGAEGCDCDPATASSQCVLDTHGRNVSLACGRDGVWRAVRSGTCFQGRR